MKLRTLALIIAILSSAILTLLLIPLEDTSRQLWVLFFIGTTIFFLVVWLFNEYTIGKDLKELNLLVKRLSNKKSAPPVSGNTLKMKQSTELMQSILANHQVQTANIEELVKMSNMRKQFIADVSHELKSPLFSAQGYVLTLLDGAVNDTEVVSSFLKKAARNLDYLDILIQDLLTLSQIESKAISMMPDHFDIVSLVQDMIEEYEAKAEHAGVTLSCTFTKSPAIVYADYTRITQVLTNLINNAINHNKKGGKVIIDVKESKNGSIISVTDTGEGIAPEYHEKIFHRFFRIDKSRTVAKSTGLGLAIVKHILENHKTTIKVDSKLGEGATFSFELFQHDDSKDEHT